MGTDARRDGVRVLRADVTGQLSALPRAGALLTARASFNASAKPESESNRFARLVGQGAREHPPERLGVGAGDFGQHLSRLIPGGRHALARQHLVDQDRERENIGAAVPWSADALRRRVGPTDRSRHADPLNRTHHAEPDHARVVGRRSTSRGCSAPWTTLAVRGEVERPAELHGHTQRVGRWHRTVLAHDDVERVGRDEVEREIRGGAGDAGGDGRSNSRVREIGGDQLLELRDELMNALGRHVQTKKFHRNESILVGIVRAKDGSQRSSSDLMEYAKWTERVRERRARNFRVQ